MVKQLEWQRYISFAFALMGFGCIAYLSLCPPWSEALSHGGSFGHRWWGEVPQPYHDSKGKEHVAAGVALRVMIWEVVAVSISCTVLALLFWNGINRIATMGIISASLLLAALFPFGIGDGPLVIVAIMDWPWFNATGDSGCLGYLVFWFVMLPCWIGFFLTLLFIRWVCRWRQPERLLQ